MSLKDLVEYSSNISKNGTQINAMNVIIQAKLIKTYKTQLIKTYKSQLFLRKENMIALNIDWFPISAISATYCHLHPIKSCHSSNIHGLRKCLVLDKYITLSPSNYNIVSGGNVFETMPQKPTLFLTTILMTCWNSPFLKHHLKIFHAFQMLQFQVCVNSILAPM